MPDPASLKSAGVCRLREGAAAVRGSGASLRGEPRQCGCRAPVSLASAGAAVMRGSGASPDCAVPGSNRRAQAIHGLLAPDPRTTASFATWMSVASSIPARAWRRQGPPKRRTPRREGRRCKGISSERYMDVPRPRVGAGRETTRRTKSPCSGGPRPKRSFCLAAAAPTRKALQQPKRFSTAGWLVMAAHPGLRRAVRQLQSPSAAATNGGATSTPVCRWAV